MQRCPSTESVTQELECTICGSVFVDPRVLSCQHVFCLRCLFALVNRDRSASLTVRCPFACPELTNVVGGGIRALKKNPIISSLCNATRKKMVMNGIREGRGACDWCSKENVPCTTCDRCHSLLCTSCQATPHSSDHGYLCPAVAHSAAPSAEIDSQLVSADSLVASQENAMNERCYPFLLTPAIAYTKIHEVLTLRKGSTGFILDPPEGVFIQHFLQNCSCTTTTQDGIDIERKLQVIVPPPPMFYNPLQAAEEERLWDCVELQMLAKCLRCSTTVKSAVQEATRWLNQTAKSVRVSCSSTDLSLAVAFVVSARQIHDISANVVIPLALRSVLFANLAGHKFCERLCQIFTHSPSQERRSIVRRLRALLERSMTLSNEATTSLRETCNDLVSMRDVITTLEDHITNRLRSVEIESDVVDNSSHRRRRVSPLLHVSSLLDAQLSSVTSLFGCLVELQQTLKAEIHDATRSVGLDDAMRERVVALEGSLETEAEKLRGLCGSSQHLHVLWLQCGVAFGRSFERSNMSRFLTCIGRFSIGHPLSVPGVDQTIREASTLVESIAPQVQGLRTKLVAFLRRNPSNLSSVSALQEQYCKLTAQVLHLHQKENFITLLEVSKQTTKYLLSCTCALLSCFVRSQPEHVVVEVLGEDVSSIGSIPWDGTEAPSSQMSQRLTRLGTFLNQSCLPFSNSERKGLLGYIQKLGQCAAGTLHANLAQSPPQVSDVDTTFVYDDSCKEFVTARAQLLVKRDVPNLKSRAIAVILGPVEKVRLPFFQGFYRFPATFPEVVFKYYVDAQTGQLFMEEPPKSRREVLFDAMDVILGSKLVFGLIAVSLQFTVPLLKKMGL